MKNYVIRTDGIEIRNRYFVAKEAFSFETESDFFSQSNSFFETTKEEYDEYYNFWKNPLKRWLGWAGLVEYPKLPTEIPF